MLRAYWEKKGQLFILLDPTRPTPRLTAFLGENGVHPQDDRILRTIAMGPVTGVLRDVTGAVKGGSAMTKRLEGIAIQFLGATQSLAIDAGASGGAQVTSAHRSR
jgi:hypothetical protein